MVYLQLIGAAAQLPLLAHQEEVIAITIHIAREILYVGVTIVGMTFHRLEVIGVPAQTAVWVSN